MSTSLRALIVFSAPVSASCLLKCGTRPQRIVCITTGSDDGGGGGESGRLVLWDAGAGDLDGEAGFGLGEPESTVGSSA